MKRLLISGILSPSAMTMPACAQVQASPEKASYKLIDIEMQLEAGADFFDPWPSGETILSGVGYIQTFGATDY